MRKQSQRSQRLASSHLCGVGLGQCFRSVLSCCPPEHPGSLPTRPSDPSFSSSSCSSSHFTSPELAGPEQLRVSSPLLEETESSPLLLGSCRTCVPTCGRGGDVRFGSVAFCSSGMRRKHSPAEPDTGRRMQQTLPSALKMQHCSGLSYPFSLDPGECAAEAQRGWTTAAISRPHSRIGSTFSP